MVKIAGSSPVLVDKVISDFCHFWHACMGVFFLVCAGTTSGEYLLSSAPTVSGALPVKNL